tara:strand:+ start:1184 stop:1948 length:765 start_codon:yes stop_codon:yes gene_type:complete
MPLIPSPSPLVDGTAASSEAVDEVLYRPLATPNNFEVINGRLDSANAPGVDVSNSHVQAGAFTSGEQVGATGRNDYFYNVFEGIALPQVGGAVITKAADLDNLSGATKEFYRLTDSDYLLIPGAAKSFYLSKTCNVLLFWYVETEAINNPHNASPAEDYLAQNDSLSLKLFLDGQSVANERRQLKCTKWLFANASPSALTEISSAELKYYRRKWSGHCIVQLTAGWHNAGIGIAHQVYHVRTTTKRFGYVALRA